MAELCLSNDIMLDKTKCSQLINLQDLPQDVTDFQALA